MHTNLTPNQFKLWQQCLEHTGKFSHESQLMREYHAWCLLLTICPELEAIEWLEAAYVN